MNRRYELGKEWSVDVDAGLTISDGGWSPKSMTPAEVLARVIHQVDLCSARKRLLLAVRHRVLKRLRDENEGDPNP